LKNRILLPGLAVGALLAFASCSGDDAVQENPAAADGSSDATSPPHGDASGPTETDASVDSNSMDASADASAADALDDTSTGGDAGDGGSGDAASDPGDGAASDAQKDANLTDTGAADAKVQDAAADVDAAPSWPTCDAAQQGAVQKTIHQIWQDDPSLPTHVWVPGVYVTGVSPSGCVANVACEIFVQQDLSYANLAAGAQQAIKLFVSSTAATHFVGMGPGSRVDIDAHASRYTLAGQNELWLQVTSQLEGCAKVVGSGNPQPVSVQLSDLTLSAYESTVGPLLVTVANISGKPAAPTESFGLWPTGTIASGDATVSLSPASLPNALFLDLTTGALTDFASVTGVFSLLVASPTGKYLQIRPRTTLEYPN
jgi:hypothetical protein